MYEQIFTLQKKCFRDRAFDGKYVGKLHVFPERGSRREKGEVELHLASSKPEAPSYNMKLQEMPRPDVSIGALSQFTNNDKIDETTGQPKKTYKMQKWVDRKLTCVPASSKDYQIPTSVRE